MPQPFSSVPGFSSWSDLTRLMQAQNGLLEQIPTTLMRLTEVLDKLAPAATDAVETVTISRRVSANIEQLVAELEQPIRDLIPAIERLTTILNDPAIAAIPTTVQRIHDEADPILERVLALRLVAVHTGQRTRHWADTVSERARRIWRGQR